MASLVQYLSASAGQQMPYMRRFDPPHRMSVLTMNPQDRTRISRYEECWRFYQGLHWGIPKEEGETFVTANITRVIADKLATWLVGAGMEITVPEALTNVTLPVIREVWKDNLQDRLLLEMATMAGITGDGFVIPSLEIPTELERSLDPHSRGRIRLRLVSSGQVFPQWDPLNQNKLLAVKIITEVGDDRLPDILSDGQPTLPTYGMESGQQSRKFIEWITPTTIIEHWEGEPPQARVNELGEVPLVHWPNRKFPGEYYGMSDLDGIIDLQRELNQKLTDQSDIVHINAAPITWVTGAKASQLEKGPRSLWTFASKDVRVGVLSGMGDLNGVQAYITFIMQLIHDLSGVPEGSLGRIQAISNTAASALEVQYGPIIEAVYRKMVCLVPALEKINYFILRLHQLLTGETFPTNLCETCGGKFLEFPIIKADGSTAIERKCFIINPVTMEYLTPDEVMVKWRRQFSFGQRTDEIPFGQAKKEYAKVGTTYWDPAPQRDLKKEAELAAEKAEQQQADAMQAQEDQAQADHERELELKQPAAEEPADGGE